MCTALVWDSDQCVLHWWGIVVNVYCIGGDSGQSVLHWWGIVVKVYCIGGG